MLIFLKYYFHFYKRIKWLICLLSNKDTFSTFPIILEEFVLMLWAIFKREQLFLNGGKLAWDHKFTALTYSNILVNWRHLFSNQMIFAAGTLSFSDLATEKRGLERKTDGWGGSWTDILGLSSAPRGTITSTSALQSAASPANRLFSHSHYGIIGAVVAGHQQYFSRSGLKQFHSACQNWKLAPKQGTYMSFKLELTQYIDLLVE